MILVADATDDRGQPCSLSFEVAIPPTAEDVRRLVAIQPFLTDATWTGRPGGGKR